MKSAPAPVRSNDAGTGATTRKQVTRMGQPTSVQWATPPPEPDLGEGKYEEFFEALRLNPGRWAIFPIANRAVPTAIEQGRYRGAPAGEFEATRRTENGEIVVYVRKRAAA